MYTLSGGIFIESDTERDDDHYCHHCGSTEEPRMEESEDCAWWICVDCDKCVESYEPEIDHSEELPF